MSFIDREKRQIKKTDKEDRERIQRNKSRRIVLLFLCGPYILAISLFFLIKPDFDDFEIPENKEQLIKIEGVVTRRAIKGRSQRHFIYVNSGSIEYQIHVQCSCSKKLIGTNVSILASHEALGRSFYDAWELISNGNSIYSFNEVVDRRRARYAERISYAWWGLFIGIFFTSIWYRSIKKKEQPQVTN